jgi:hypothetical protein
MANLDDDDVFNVLEEAQALMEEMGDEEGVDSIVIDGFSIDDVLDDEPPIIDARTVLLNPNSTIESAADNSMGAPNPAAITKVVVGEDPLSLFVPTSSSPLAEASRRSSITSLTDEQVAPSRATTLTAPSLAEVKARASGFASSLSSFAQKAVAAVSDNARTQVSAMNQGGQSQPSAAFPSANNSNVYSPLIGVPIVQVVELDNDQKNALIQQHLGSLLPGERVIMFLSSLLHVSDSTGWDLNLTTRDNTEGMWCCCMTFYRVVLFHTFKSNTIHTPPSNWDVDCWPCPPHPTILQMPLASIDRVEKSIYTTSQNSTLMGLVLYGYVRSLFALSSSASFLSVVPVSNSYYFGFAES